MAGNLANEEGYGRKNSGIEEETKNLKLSDMGDFIKIEHTVFDLPFIVAGSFIAAGGYPGLKILILVLLAGTLARASGMAINRVLGRRYDLINPRKRDWILVNGRMSLIQAFSFIFLTVGLFEVTTFFLNRLVFELSPVVLILFIIDPMLKKYTQWRHFFMGLTIGVGVMAGYLAALPVFPSSPEVYILVLATGTWIGGFDMIYTIPDREYDIKNGLKTVMTAYGIRKGMVISSVTHAFTILFFALLLFYIPSYFYIAGLVLISVLIIYQHVILNPEDPKTIKVSFLNANSFIGIIFLIVLIFTQYLH
ncbi:UbiA-like polyprenyltransferase [Cuniculiplasma sp. SKW3]|uniref:UbiA-like polyprenyltransferase n=1 Tax=Cuniculiplasma sp. SKW3 TaxID=3400170 RepID=UPI003FD3DFE1